MWKQGGIRHWSCLSKPTNYANSPASGSRIQNIQSTGHCSQHRMNRPSSSTSCKFWSHVNTGSCVCWKDMQLLCIMSSLSTMTYSITWMASYELCLRRRHNGRLPYTLPWRLHARSCPNIMPKSLQQPVFISLQLISLIVSASCDHFESGTRRWRLILRMRRLILPNTWRPFWSMRWTNTALNIEECLSLNPKMFGTATSSPRQRILDLVNHLLIHMICPAMMTNN